MNEQHLTPTELKVLRAIPVAVTNKAIASMLFIGEKTVKAHLFNIFGKTGCESRIQLLVWGIRHGYIIIEPQEEK